jgi:diketogulonate reductase-like aldo/keto reductase
MEIPSFGIGTYKLKDDNCYNIIKKGLNMGYRLIDTAELYDNHKSISQAINDSEIDRSQIWITTKIHNRDQRHLKISEAIDKIKKDLNIDYIDLVLLHSPQKTYRDAYKELISCKSQFNICNIGVSNFKIDELDKIISDTNITPFLNQIEINPFNQRIELRKYCSDKNINVQAYSSLVCGNSLNHPDLLNDYYTPVESLLNWARFYNLRPIPTMHTEEHLLENYNILSSELPINTDIIKSLDNISDIIINYKQHSDISKIH